MSSVGTQNDVGDEDRRLRKLRKIQIQNFEKDEIEKLPMVSCDNVLKRNLIPSAEKTRLGPLKVVHFRHE
jgi:hypothetical protein